MVNYEFSFCCKYQRRTQVLSVNRPKQENEVKQCCLTTVDLVHIGTRMSILILAKIISDFNNEPI